MRTVNYIGNNPIKNSKRGKLIGVKIDYKLTYNCHIDQIYKKAGQKMNVLPLLKNGALF